MDIEDSIRWLESMSEPFRSVLPSPVVTTAGIGMSVFGNLGNQAVLGMLPQPSEPITPPMITLPDDTKGTFSQFLLLRLETLEGRARALGFKRTLSRMIHLREHIRTSTSQVDTWADPEMPLEIKVLRQAFRDDVEEQPIFLPNVGRAAWYKQEKPFGERVYDAFPRMRTDIIKAGDCYATDNDTACVFHLMRIVERAIRLLAKRLHAPGLKAEIDYEDWKVISTAINKKLSELRNSKRGKQREKELTFYADLADRCQYFKEMWRDNVSHSRVNYDDAAKILLRVHEFIERMAERLKEPA